MKVSAQTNINSTKEKVWEVITDIENSVNVISGIINIEILNPVGDNLVGLKWKETRKMFGKEAVEVMWVTHSKKYDYYQTRAESHGAIYLSRLNITDKNNGVVTLEMSFEGQAASLPAKIMSGVFGVFMKKSMKKVLEVDLEDIKKSCEAQ
ncbi:SRPBCC family protein [Sporosarcina siberiensis]|uniref:SRPBCC family protein n=1 Tax=Sporosarcina siberiensis TaxID=1365606 RepID=A0ABW4SE89_9BACL